MLHLPVVSRTRKFHTRHFLRISRGGDSGYSVVQAHLNVHLHLVLLCKNEMYIDVNVTLRNTLTAMRLQVENRENLAKRHLVISLFRNIRA